MFKGLPARAIHLGFALLLAFLIFPISKKKNISAFDILIGIVGAFCCLYILKSVGEYVYENLKSNDVIINKPKGGFYLMPEFTNKNFSTSSEMCKTILRDTGVALLPGSDFGCSEKKMLARLSFTDFDGVNFMNDFNKNKTIDLNSINNFAPKIIEGTKRLREWSESA